ncbi:ASCH domain-containing protein [Actinacidiphila oryziradicis]|uniref:ASCH domain-containing protein n=1 Tax=Actinacidiphila oryziradicis TaxID=2571141 RepID=A0A4U0S705_9ACTN|nr:ASCH domain-containing protein [Actinacidiphila oryziradicis]TKA04904.1 ASCH domain-containing protein [Actinacidiphila oryziradicis]
MNDNERALLLSLHPRFADSILDGTKTVEIRRQRVAVPVGTPVILYATSPVMALVGTAQVEHVQVARPAEVWATHTTRTALSRVEFDDYTDGARYASAVVLRNVEPLSQQVPLSHLRSAGDFHPPQSYRYLSMQDLRQLVTEHPMAPTLLRRIAPVSSASIAAVADVTHTQRRNRASTAAPQPVPARQHTRVRHA